jgi:hypothetical protein
MPFDAWMPHSGNNKVGRTALELHGEVMVWETQGEEDGDAVEEGFFESTSGQLGRGFSTGTL